MSCIEGISSHSGCEKAKKILLFYSKMENFLLGIKKLDLILLCLHLLFYIFSYVKSVIIYVQPALHQH